MLPAFSFDQTVSPQTAKQDKLEIKIEDGALLTDIEGAERFLRVLGAPPLNQRGNPNISPFGEYFRGQQGYEDHFDNQPIRSVAFVSGGKRFPPPLVGGHLEIFPSRHHNNVWRLNILASLNPTRFLRHQRLPWLLRPFSQEPPPALETNLFERSVGASYDEEFALCRNEQHKGDNWIPNMPSWQYYASATSWPTQMRNCLTTWPNTLLNELSRAVEVADTPAPVQLTHHANGVALTWFSGEALLRTDDHGNATVRIFKSEQCDANVNDLLGQRPGFGNSKFSEDNAFFIPIQATIPGTKWPFGKYGMVEHSYMLDFQNGPPSVSQRCVESPLDADSGLIPIYP